MNTHLDNMPLDPRFDRLVDGELNEEERQELLAGLDNEPGGWRRCAVAFLEAQCWKQEFGELAQQQVPASTLPGAIRSRRARWLGRLGTPLAMAASFLVALWLGSALQQARVGRLALRSGQETTGGMASNAGSRQPPAPLTQPALGPWRFVNVAALSGSQDGGESFELPAVERENIDPQWLERLPSAIPDNVLQALNRTGHQIQQHRELFPIRLKDGRQLVVPVDQVEVKYVGGKSY